METQLYIPKRIKVGYQKRNDTYTKRLAYIIYYDDKNVLRKEKSWEGWRHKDIEPEEFDNKPQSGLVLNKDIKRYNWGHFSSNRTMIRVYDPRDMEFEITTENLIGVLMNTDCSKRGLTGEFVYAWHGPELVLLPTNCEEYTKAMTFTDLQSKKIGVKDMVGGCMYRTKKEGDLIYVGRYNWYTLNYHYNYYRSDDKENLPRKAKKYHIFTKDGNTFETKSGLEFLALKLTEMPVSNFAEIIENFQNNIHSGEIVKWEVVPVEPDLERKQSPHYPEQKNFPRKKYYKIDKDTLISFSLDENIENKYDSVTHVRSSVFCGYKLSIDSKLDIPTQTYIKPPLIKNHYSWSYASRMWEGIDLMQKEQLLSYGLGELYVTFDSGRRLKIEELYKLN